MSRIIIQNGNICELDLPLKFAQKLYAEFAIRHPNAFYLRTRQRGMQNWDGKIHYINKHGEFKIGLLPAVYEKCIEYGIKPKVVDMRQPLPKVNGVVTKIGEYKLRPEQEKAVKAVINNKVGKVPFQIGVLDYTVNAGKTLIMSSLYLSYKKQLKTLLITNDSDWLNQARDEFKKYLPGEQITFVQGKVLNWSNFTIGMVQSISRNMRFYQNELSKVDMVLVDEADQAGSKQYQNVLTRLFNTRVRIGLSGTIYMSKLAKDKVKNMNLEVFFGKVLAEFKLKDSIKKGYSTRTIVKMVPSKPWYGNWESEEVSYKEVYDDSITFNKYAKRMVYSRLKWNLKQDRYPALVVCKFIAHCENLCKYFKKKLGSKYNIACVHVDTPSKIRQQIMKDFREGKIDILVSTTIIARGKNFPKLRYLLNAASMDSQEKSIQFLGRLVRTDSSKKKVYLDDLHYPGPYLNRHGKHWESEEVSYKEVYDDSITFNKYAKRMVYSRLKWNLKQDRYPALVVCKFIAHCENLCKYFKKKLGSKYNIACVHVDTPSKIRQQIMKDFREGKIDILVSTTIIARGKNFPKLRYLLNAASMDSQEKSIQFLGRLVRTDSSKKKVYLDDLHYPGPYLNRHGKHRKQYYQKQELKVILLEKIWKNHSIHSL